ncbi:PREDICTED: putative insulin-like growth factor 2 antisense gene protein [Dipodomys ordii]|uniref:Insulin-like growth factor 2 antisense gene protein n=1 Tax=Dipodomys ordii TaxID=10020 RepID=A0A1S3FLK2_DIPOR|nr:PREDICTED: putative insulin-like growth factor 2 antisense gene protein [Dipodomys ordii]
MPASAFPPPPLRPGTAVPGPFSAKPCPGFRPALPGGPRSRQSRRRPADATARASDPTSRAGLGPGAEGRTREPGSDPLGPRRASQEPRSSASPVSGLGYVPLSGRRSGCRASPLRPRARRRARGGPQPAPAGGRKYRYAPLLQAPGSAPGLGGPGSGRGRAGGRSALGLGRPAAEA